MEKKLMRLIPLIIISILAVIFLASSCNASTPETASKETTAEATVAETTAEETSTTDLNQVICKNNRFQPDTLTVRVGTTVTWINQDGFIHTVTSGTSPSERSGLFDSGNLNAGETFSFTFDQARTYDYFCIPHYSLGMIGKIIVTE